MLPLKVSEAISKYVMMFIIYQRPYKYLMEGYLYWFKSSVRISKWIKKPQNHVTTTVLDNMNLMSFQYFKLCKNRQPKRTFRQI